MKRSIVTGLWIVAAAVVGGTGGFYAGWHGALNTVYMTDMFVAAQHDTYLTVLRTKGNDAAYEDALRSQLSFLNAMQARSRDPSDQRMYTFDRALTLARLSTLVQKRGANAEAASLAHDAEALCPAIGLRDCSANTLVEAAHKIDNGLIGVSEESK